jgi:glucose dehydrogenase
VSAGDWSIPVGAQGRGRGAGPAPSAAAAPSTPAPGREWTTYGADLASTRYSPLDQINKDNFGTLEIAWRLNTNHALLRHAADGQRHGSTLRSARGVSYWSSPDGRDQRIIDVTPGYRMLALDARTGIPVPTFGTNGVVDIPGAVTMPAKQTGSPMTYMHNGKQYIVLAVGGGVGGSELIAYALR